jgi:hypothetical protein
MNTLWICMSDDHEGAFYLLYSKAEDWTQHRFALAVPILVVLPSTLPGFVAAFPNWRCRAQNYVAGSSPTLCFSRILRRYDLAKCHEVGTEAPFTFDWVGRGSDQGCGWGRVCGRQAN